jgi:hypothetical protein
MSWGANRVSLPGWILIMIPEAIDGFILSLHDETLEENIDIVSDPRNHRVSVLFSWTGTNAKNHYSTIVAYIDRFS